MSTVPTVSIQLDFEPEENEKYGVKDILVDVDNWIGGILYSFQVKSPDELLDRIRAILSSESDDSNIQMSLLPIDLYEYTITVPGKGSKVPYEILSHFRSVSLAAERDDFAINTDRIGSKALTSLMQDNLDADAQAKIEKKYSDFFNTVKTEGKMDEILNWQEYSDIDNAQDFFHRISVLPNIPKMNSILGGIRLGYDDEYMFTQGLGHRNLVLMTVLLNSYISRGRDISFRLMTVEEPEAHLCISNVLLMGSLLNSFTQKNRYTQIVYSTHNVELVNKIGLESVIVFHKGDAFNLGEELSSVERKYLAANPNTDIFKLLYSKKAILVEGLTEELLIKAYLQNRPDLNNIKVLSFHKGYTKIIDIWGKINVGSGNKLGIVRDFDNQPKAQEEHEKRQNENIIVRTTKGKTLEIDIVAKNYELLKQKYGEVYGWSNKSAEAIQDEWQTKKSDVMLRICDDLVKGELEGFHLPSHIQQIVDFMQES